MIFLNDSYVKEFQAPIQLVEGDKVITADSCFYAQSGGQPGDKGSLEINGEKFNVINTLKHEKGIAHVLDQPCSASTGEVVGIIDWDHRYRLMRMHTSMHLLCAALPYYVTGGSIGLEKSRIDFDLGEETFEFETLNTIINEFIQHAHPISYQWITNEELDQQPELVRTLSVKPPRTNDKIRLVKIGTIDLQPCGGTHVANTSEIGEFQFIKYESKGKMNKRVQFTLD
ncbi:alanyl-tRNA editing protein [Alphaproteobacteria bacterium]|nr:alanyl-tRNA editing protein [Alphaproteobacteria bacterium]MDB3974063.1 alanyl-tRNA editing protein [Alphaproteobacteria bacterium]MDC0594417.1 alanyl-tRNA editing protein [Alphaproteobacteria bacterium]